MPKTESSSSPHRALQGGEGRRSVDGYLLGMSLFPSNGTPEQHGVELLGSIHCCAGLQRCAAQLTVTTQDADPPTSLPSLSVSAGVYWLQRACSRSGHCICMWREESRWAAVPSTALNSEGAHRLGGVCREP
jgi:hypothetical protein